LRFSRLNRLARTGIGKNVIVVLVIIVVAAAVAALYAGGGLASSQTSSTSITTASTSSSSSHTSSASTTGPAGAAGLAINHMYGDVNGPASDKLNDNGTMVNNDTVYLGNPGDTLTVAFDILYAQCTSSCPSHVTAVTADSGFTVLKVSPPLPIPVQNPAGAGTGQIEFHFTVTVKAPATPFNGVLTLVATTQ
jgi:hypothetical protein